MIDHTLILKKFSRTRNYLFQIFITRIIIIIIIINILFESNGRS